MCTQTPSIPYFSLYILQTGTWGYGGSKTDGKGLSPLWEGEQANDKAGLLLLQGRGTCLQMSSGEQNRRIVKAKEADVLDIFVANS
ncbi:hypothetical protein CEXT_355471 [Caerostris extrusa]|uniref:Uncharacterized protein n=1 Tax=Caerostris extrusa TaxID=172846 RepID=A0AAV4XR87_CAEEX|nr:hypothetical protein CEXT_355471 [Caerostris extrusa]